MRPTDVLLHRRVMHEWAMEQLRDFDEIVANMSHAYDFEEAEWWREMLSVMHFASGNGEVYWVNADMTAVARSAAPTMPSQILRVDDLPSPSGFLLYDSPIAETLSDDDRSPEPIVGFIWSLSDVRPYWSHDAGEVHGEIVGPVDFDQAEDGDPDGYTQWVDIQPLSSSSIPGGPTLMPAAFVGYSMRWKIGGEPVNDNHKVAALLLATWTLMQQTLTVSEHGSGDRAERRRCARSGLASDVVIIRLRRRSVDGEEDATAIEGSIGWSHRWLVSGHWRNQWLPSRSAHRVQWISSYVKGPENKPLLIKDRVTAWVR